jgi:hypothetical protein
MKLEELFEMTMKFGKTGLELDDALKNIYNDRKNYKHVGDINKANVLYKNNIYLLINDNIPIGFFQVFKRSKIALVQNMFVSEKFRRAGWMSMFLFFLKQNESYDKIQLGSQHSNDTVEAIKRISSRFKVYWEKDGKIKPYDIETINDFYSDTKETGWNIILENTNDYSHYPKFWNNKDVIPDLRILYDRLLTD